MAEVKMGAKLNVAGENWWSVTSLFEDDCGNNRE